jgi:hypothetical protein
MSFVKIYCIDSVDLALIKTSPPGLIVSVRGRATSSGWSDARLAEYVYLRPPADGVQDFDVVAERPAPGTVVLREPTPITAERTLAPIDVTNYWGPGLPLKGVRCHAVANSKIALLEAQQGMPAARAVEGNGVPAYPPATGHGPGFAADIRPLFRARDVNAMKVFAGFDLHDYDDVKANAPAILKRLQDRSMPCDGAWPQSDIDLFANWIDSGTAA